MLEKLNRVNSKKLLMVVGTILIVMLALAGCLSIARWGQTHAFQNPWVFTFQTRPLVKVLEPQVVLSPVITEIVKEDDSLSPIERKIVHKFGERYGYIALSIFRCESGLRADAVNWTSKDVGVAQINWPTWEKQVKEKFNYTLADMFDVGRNLDVALWIADRDGDGKDMDFGPWAVFQTGSFKSCIK